MREFWTVFFLTVLITTSILDHPTKHNQQLVPDVSWPQCGMQLPKQNQGIVGVNGGRAGQPNLCLKEEAANYRHLSVYVNTGYPGVEKSRKFQTSPKKCGTFDEECLAYNYGYNTGKYSINYSLINGVLAKYWWLDVETANSWSDSTKVNRAALQGGLDALSKFAGKGSIGFYSYHGQWDLITGKWRNNYLAWSASGSTKIEDAIEACSFNFTGGQVLLGQFTPELDQNYICKSY